MDNYIIYGMGMIMLIMLLAIILKPFSVLLKICIKGIVGGGAIYLFNLLFINIGITIGINIFTCGFIGVFGIPGFITLYAIRAVI